MRPNLVNHGYIIMRAVQLLTTVSVILPSYFAIRHLVRRYMMMSENHWPSQSPRWTSLDKSMLLSEKSIGPVPDVSLGEVIENSSKFPIPFPIETVRCSYLKRKIAPEELSKTINSAYPVIHEHALLLCSTFLNHQTQFGNREFYKNMSLLQFIDRLLSKRAVAFVGSGDHYLLLSGEEGDGNWERVGREDQTPPLTLDGCLSYDEIKLSALLSVSSHSFFINDGSRTNYGEFESKREKVEESGVIVGLIGARLEKGGVMEYREIVKAQEQNTQELGYGPCPTPTMQGKFLEFYGDDNALYEELREKMKSSPDRYIELGGGEFFDKLMFERRMALSIDTLLLEANHRAKAQGKQAYIHVVGLGLGVWKICRDQDQIFMDTFAKRMEFLKDVLTNISDVRFAYIRSKMAGPYKDGDRLNGVRIHIENKNPQEKLRGADAGKLLVVSYPWDGNAFPGNEFWCGPRNLAASGDPAAASSSQISEIHNYYINGKVRANNLRVATLSGLVTFQECQQMHKDD